MQVWMWVPVDILTDVSNPLLIEKETEIEMYIYTYKYIEV